MVPEGEGMGKESGGGRGVEREEGVQRGRGVQRVHYVIGGVGCCTGLIGGLEAAVVLSACLLAVQLLWLSTGGVDAVRRVNVGPHTQHNAGLLLAVHAHRHAKLRPDVASAVSCFQLHVAGDSCGGDGGGGAAESDDDYDGQVVFSDVPMEVVQVILQHLDPISLAAAACVCR